MIVGGVGAIPLSGSVTPDINVDTPSQNWPNWLTHRHVDSRPVLCKTKYMGGEVVTDIFAVGAFLLLAAVCVLFVHDVGDAVPERRLSRLMSTS